MSRLAINKEILRNLAICSKNKCAFPGCSRPLMNEHEVYVAELCHIEAAEPGGQRYNPLSTDEQRRASDNLMFMCHEHHKETDDELRYSVARLKEIKRAHEELLSVVFNADLLLRRMDEVAAEQTAIRKMLGNKPQYKPSENYRIFGPELQECWTPESGRFYETRTGEKSKFKYMMRDGWLHIEQTLKDGAVAYYEVDETGSVRDSRMPYPINEYMVVIPEELVLRKESVQSSIGTHAIKTVLKWSKGSVTEHFHGNLFIGADCNAICNVNQETKTINII